MSARVRITGLADGVTSQLSTRGVTVAFMTDPTLSVEDRLGFAGLRASGDGTRRRFVGRISDTSSAALNLNSALTTVPGEIYSAVDTTLMANFELADSNLAKRDGFAEQEYIFEVKRSPYTTGTPAVNQSFIFSVYKPNGDLIVRTPVTTANIGNVLVTDEGRHLYLGFVVAGVKAEISDIKVNVGVNNQNNDYSAVYTFAANPEPVVDQVIRIVIPTANVGTPAIAGVNYQGVLSLVTEAGFKHTLSAFIDPSTVTAGNITWTSSDTALAQVSAATTQSGDTVDITFTDPGDFTFGEFRDVTITASGGGLSTTYVYRIRD
jgi:hypothetical protein